MESRPLGNWGLSVSAVGLGCVGMSEFYGPVDKLEATRAIHAAVDLGMTLFDTADIYGHGENERLVGKAIADRRDRVILATKFGNLRRSTGEFVALDGSPAYVSRACDGSLKRLGVDVIDLFQLHRTDPKTPIEETVGAMYELVQQGKVRYLGLSEARPTDIDRASATAPISVLQSEYSVLERGIEREVLDTCARHGIGLLAYSPLGRGLLTGKIRDESDFGPEDSRRDGRYPRLVGEALKQNLELVKPLLDLARSTGRSPAQLALAWLLAQGHSVVPIPGAKRTSHVIENALAADIHLTERELEALNAIVGEAGAAFGDRYVPDQIPLWVSPPHQTHASAHEVSDAR